MAVALGLAERLHARALKASAFYKRAEADLIDVLTQIEAHRVFLKRGHSSLYHYAVSELRLGENIAYSLITVARKCIEVPELKAKLQAGEITLTNARRVVSVLTSENKSEWLLKAERLSQRELEKEIVRVHPKEATKERASYVTSDRVRLELGLSEQQMLRLRRVQDLLSQSKRRPVSLEEAMQALISEFLKRHDPVEKAKRHQVRKGSSVEKATASEKPRSDQVPNGFQAPPLVARREEVEEKERESEQEQVLEQKHALTQERVQGQRRAPIPAAILHRVRLRDQQRCRFVLHDGTRCNQSRWVEIHHRIPLSQGGTHTFDNLITLCSSHHKYAHVPTRQTS
jgi:5-methylcytosine-specific restriction protein A